MRSASASGPRYCAVAIAGLHLDDLPDTLRKRSVILKMRARLKNEKVEPWRVRIHEPEAKKLGGKIAKWSRLSSREIRWPKLPPGIEDRNADVWEPLIAVADAAGGEWPGKARAAALTLVSLTRDKAVSIGVRLLRDLRTIWGDARARHTADILTKLREMSESEWKGAEGRRSALSDRELAKLLGAYDIDSDDINLDGKTLKGYWRTDRREGKGSLTDAWERYLGACQEQSAQPAQSESRIADVAEVASKSGLGAVEI